MVKRIPYAERSDVEKIQSQWKKANGLHARDESSAAIVRAATAMELAANLAIRKEFEAKSELDKTFVDGLLLWANGIAGKIDRLLIPITKGETHHKAITKLKAVSAQVNKKRNSVAHSGEFCNSTESAEIIKAARRFLKTLLKIYEPDFVLEEHQGKN